MVSMGVRSIYPWQSPYLLGKGALAGAQNPVYTAPTSRGKLLVADILLFKKVIEQPAKKAILALPMSLLCRKSSNDFKG
jgi:replicative superfamily II helicase